MSPWWYQEKHSLLTVVSLGLTLRTAPQLLQICQRHINDANQSFLHAQIRLDSDGVTVKASSQSLVYTDIYIYRELIVHFLEPVGFVTL